MDSVQGARSRVLDADPARRYQISGGGFGPTVQLNDGTLITAYSYRGSSELMQLDSFIVQKQQIEVVRWHLPPQ